MPEPPLAPGLRCAPPPPPPPPPPRSLGGPLNGLRLIAAAPHTHPGATVVDCGATCGDSGIKQLVVVPDAYPKAARHALVLPVGRGGAVPATPAELATWPGDVAALVRAMLEAARAWAAAHPATTAGGARVPFRVGFHSVPSLSPLHAHVVSQDFVSPALKTKKHVNSFSSPFFVDLDDVVAALDARRPLPLLAGDDAAAALKAGLKCPRCGEGAATMPALKRHLDACDGGWPAGAEFV